MNSVYRNNEVSLSADLSADLRELTQPWADDRIFLVFEENTWLHCWPLVKGFREIKDAHCLVLKAGEDHKTLAQVEEVWSRLGAAGIDRRSLIINIGGGMLTDLGGFAASTLKRGVPFLNVPTTLLAMVDASVGGKSGINYRGLKNEIGVIRQPVHVLLYLKFLRSLDRDNVLSGFAEMLKAGLIADRVLWAELAGYNLEKGSEERLGSLIWRSVEIKKTIVDSDPEEKGMRKALNFGHTIGHALESESLKRGQPIAHGFAVAWGMIAESLLSQIKLGLEVRQVEEIRDTILQIYGNPPALLRDFESLLPWMKFDKKNTDHRINFTLLEQIGQCRVNCTATEEEIIRSLKGEF